MKKALASLLALAASLSAFSAQAQTKGGFALDRFDPSERGSDWFALESLDLRGNGRMALGVVGEWAYKPLVIYDENGDEVTAVVEHQVFAHVGGAVNLFDWRDETRATIVVVLVFAMACTACWTFDTPQNRVTPGKGIYV